MPILARHRPAFVVAPAPTDLEIPGREPLETESCVSEERDRCRFPGLDVGLKTVESHGSEDVTDEEFDRLVDPKKMLGPE